MSEDKTPQESKEQAVVAETKDIDVTDVKATDPAAAREMENVKPTDADIKKLKRGELNALAADYGLNPDDYGKADDLRSAIFKHLQTTPAEAETEVAANAEKDNEPSGERPKKAAKANPPWPKLERRSRRYQTAHKLIDKDKPYELAEAAELIGKTSTVKFDASVELHINLGVDPKQSDQLVRGQVVLPHGSGKSQRIAVLAPEAEQAKAKKAGAERVGHEDLLADISAGKLDFDVLLAHPDVMKDLSKQARVLGPKGLMPSPKAGTVSADLAKAIAELKAGRVEFRIDRYGIIHQMVGRCSFTPKVLQENITVLLQAIKAARPSSTKGAYFKKITLTTSMGPGLRINAGTL